MDPASIAACADNFSSALVSKYARVTIRQLQFWDEKRLVVPQKIGRHRLYSLMQVSEVLIVAELRSKGSDKILKFIWSD
jgi:DNA-binding transcriptional MerR regulator